MAKGIDYINRDFDTFVGDLKNYIKTRFPEDFNYFNSASPDMMYLEMCAYMGVVLGENIDKAFNESFISEAQSRGSLVRSVNDFNFNNFSKTASQTQLKVKCNVPYIVDNELNKPDPTLFMHLKKGMIVSSNSGTKFETLEDINFADERNRQVIPNYNNNGELIDFTIIKSVTIRSGITKVQRLYIDTEQATPFLKVTISDTDVTEISGVIGLPGNQYQIANDSIFDNLDYQYYHVDFLSRDKIFVELEDNVNNPNQIKQGDWVEIPKRFIIKRDVNNIVTLIFGSSTTNFDLFEDLIKNFVTDINLNQVLNNTTLGEIPTVDSTLFIKYRTGGGLDSNAQPFQITNIVSKEFYSFQLAFDADKLARVRNSLQVYNKLPAVGGSEEMSNEEIRYTAPKVYAAQDRVVTYEDVRYFIANLPSKFGRPYKLGVEELKPGVLNLDYIKQDIFAELDLIDTEYLYFKRKELIQKIKSKLDSYQQISSTITSNNTSIINQQQLNNLIVDNNTLSLWLGEKTRIYIISQDETGKLVSVYKDTNGIWQYPQEILKENIKKWLLDKRLIGDWFEIYDGRIVNLQCEFTVIVDQANKQEVLSKCLQALKDYFNINNWQIGQPIYVANVQTILQQINGVTNVVDLKFYNIWGTNNSTGRKYSDLEPGRYKNIIIPTNDYTSNRYEIQLYNNTILGFPSTIFEFKFPDLDFIGKVL